MSSFNRRAFFVLPLALAACGFQPAYGPKGAAARLQGHIRSADPQSKDDTIFVQTLEDRLGRPQVPIFELAYTITTTVEGAGISPTNAITRFNLVGAVSWTLTLVGTGVQVAKGQTSGVTSWSATGNTVAAQSAEDDASVRLMQILADQVTSQLIAAPAELPQQ